MFYETTHPTTSDYFKIEKRENFSFPPHIHRHFELITISDGEMTVTVDSREYILKKGEALLIFPNQIHSLNTESTSRHILCIFAPELVKAFWEKTAGKLPTDNKFALPKLSAELLSGGNFDDLSAKGFLYLSCAEFNKTAVYTEKDTKSDDLLNRIFLFVEQNRKGNCSLKDLAGSTAYDYSYLSKYFKKTVGISFSSYVNAYRLGDVCYLLKNTSRSVTDIALDCGYTSLRSFNRNFKDSFNMTPKEYRK